jgi:hypothetical protein
MNAPEIETSDPRTAQPEPRMPQPLTRALPLVVGLAVLAGLVLAGRAFGAPGVVLGLVGLSLVGVIAALWASLRTLIGETPLSGADAYALGARIGEEEQKRAILRALKDLEFERSVGKISEDDYQQLLASYRSEAKRLLRAIDDGASGSRARAAKLAEHYLAERGVVRDGAPETEAVAETATAMATGTVTASGTEAATATEAVPATETVAEAVAATETVAEAVAATETVAEAVAATETVAEAATATEPVAGTATGTDAASDSVAVASDSGDRR